jgi:chorismate mutase
VKKVAILQSNYIPWKGYFDLIASVDEFIVFDEVQYTRRDWRNRNKIKTSQGIQWLTVPVQVKGKYFQKISQTMIDGLDWRDKHWKTLELNYCKSPYFDSVSEWLKPLYYGHYTYLSELNISMIRKICNYLDFQTNISNSSDFQLLDNRSERLAHLCQQVGASKYISGPSAKDYIEEEFFLERDIEIEWIDYLGYKEYPQLWGEPFVHEVSILDLIFNCGKSSRDYLKNT